MIDVLVPWRDGEPQRERVWGWVRTRWRDAGFHVIEGHARPGEWCKATAVVDAADQSTTDIVIVADADVWTDGIAQAVHAVHQGAAWAIPHHQVHRLTEEATEVVLAGGPLEGGTEIPPYRGMEGGGIVVLPRRTIFDVPMDPRFVGWGGEDTAWSAALDTLAGPRWRGSADLWHLWHAPQPRPAQDRRTVTPESKRLLYRYTAGSGCTVRIGALIEEAKEALWPSKSSSTAPASASSFAP